MCPHGTIAARARRLYKHARLRAMDDASALFD